MLEEQYWKKDKESPSITALLFLLACDDSDGNGSSDESEYNSSENNPNSYSELEMHSHFKNESIVSKLYS
jgi:hypothetical protein